MGLQGPAPFVRLTSEHPYYHNLDSLTDQEGAYSVLTVPSMCSEGRRLFLSPRALVVVSMASLCFPGTAVGLFFLYLPLGT